MWVPGVCALLAVTVGGRPELAVILFALAAGLNTFTVSGCKVGMCDIAPDYAGIVFSVSNTISNIPGFIVPAVVGSLLTDYTDTNQWFYVFSLGLGCTTAQYFCFYQQCFLLDVEFKLQEHCSISSKEVPQFKSGRNQNMKLKMKSDERMCRIFNRK